MLLRSASLGKVLPRHELFFSFFSSRGFRPFTGSRLSLRPIGLPAASLFLPWFGAYRIIRLRSRRGTTYSLRHSAQQRSLRIWRIESGNGCFLRDSAGDCHF